MIRTEYGGVVTDRFGFNPASNRYDCCGGSRGQPTALRHPLNSSASRIAVSQIRIPQTRWRSWFLTQFVSPRGHHPPPSMGSRALTDQLALRRSPGAGIRHLWRTLGRWACPHGLGPAPSPPAPTRTAQPAGRGPAASAAEEVGDGPATAKRHDRTEATATCYS